MPTSNLIGRRFGRLIVISMELVNGMPWCLCKCDCSSTPRIRAYSLTQSTAGATRSCGCLARELTRARSTTHGHKRDGKPTKEYQAWTGMKNRCLNAKDPAFKRYGGRGVTMCEHWHSFENFLADMGPMPTDQRYSLDRKDNNGGYEPSNCRWATYDEQNNNKRSNRLLTFGGLTLTMSQWAKRQGLNYNTLLDRLRNGWSIEKALTVRVMR